MRYSAHLCQMDSSILINRTAQYIILWVPCLFILSYLQISCKVNANCEDEDYKHVDSLEARNTLKK